MVRIQDLILFIFFRRLRIIVSNWRTLSLRKQKKDFVCIWMY